MEEKLVVVVAGSPKLDNREQVVKLPLSHPKICLETAIIEEKLLDQLVIFGKPRVHRRARGEVVFRNPANETLTNCHLTLSGSGLWRDEVDVKIPDLKPNVRVRVKFFFYPYKAGEKTAMADFDCNGFKDIKVSCPVNIEK